MTACQRIKREILQRALANLKDEPSLTEKEREFVEMMAAGVTEESMDASYDALDAVDLAHDIECDFRRGQIETGLSCEGSRHYSSKSVASKLSDGSWVGWTYWYGGGKHGEPGSIDWMSDAYDLQVTEVEKKVLVLEFRREGPSVGRVDFSLVVKDWSAEHAQD